MSTGGVVPRVSMTLVAALVLDYGSDVPYAHLERQRVLRVHARSLLMNVTMFRTVRSGRPVTLMNIPPLASAKLGIVPAWIP